MESGSRIKIDSTIKGYHVFHVRPHVDIEMILVPEPRNRFDPNAFGVWMPNLSDIPGHLRDTETREGQTVRQIAGTQVGRVPANLCRVFRELLDQGLLANVIKCTYGGTVHVARRVPVHQSFQRQGIRDRVGGGAELDCKYFLMVPRRRFKTAMRVFERCLSPEELDRISC